LQNISQVISRISPGQRVFVHGGAATPCRLIEEIIKQKDRLPGLEFIHLHTEGAGAWGAPELAGHFKVVNLFVGHNMRRQLDYINNDYLPCFLSEIPSLFRSKKRRIDVALLHLASPNSEGKCSLGTSVDVALAAFDSATVKLAQINTQMPFVNHEPLLSKQELTAWCSVDDEIPEMRPASVSEVDQKIGQYVANLVQDGDCLQVGIGGVPNAALAALKSHKHLGIHSEMWSDGVLDLIEAGAVDNSRKMLYPGITVSSFIIGTKRVYQFIHNNPQVLQLGADYVNNPRVISSNPNVVSINSAVEIDLTGQVCADSVGHRIISGVGGQVDFIRGAQISQGGRVIIALPSQTKTGKSRIVHELMPGAGVVSTRAHVHFIVTEFGAVDLYGMTLHERAKALTQIAHPSHREQLEREWFNCHRSCDN